MAQHDYVIANGTGAAVRSDLNNGLAAIVTQNSGATEPTTTYAFMRWADTTAGVMKMRNSANSAWITLYQLDGEWTNIAFENGTAAAPSIYFKDSGTDTGFYSPGANQVGISTGGTAALVIDSSQRVGLGTSTPSNAKLDVRDDVSYPVRWGSTSAQFGELSYETGNCVIGATSGNKLTLRSAGTAAITIDTSQRVGIGTTSPGYPLQVDTTGTGTAAGDNTAIYVQSQASGRDCNIRFGDSVNASARIGYLSNNLYFYVNGNERARIDNSGRLLVGTSSSNSTFSSAVQIAGTSADATQLVSRYTNGVGGPLLYFSKSRSGTIGTNTIVQSDDELGTVDFRGANGSGYDAGARIQAYVDGTPGASGDMPGRLVFSTTADGASSPTERMRITNNGLFKFTSDGAYTDIDPNSHGIRQTLNGEWILKAVNAHASSPYGFSIAYTGASPNGTSNQFLQCSDSTTNRITLRSNGGIANYSGNNVNLSDINTKKDISLAAGTWDCLKEWEIVNFRYKEQPDDADLNMGVIAQQVAESCPEVITVFQEAKEDQPEKLGVKEQQMMWMAIKALQEAQLRIEALEAEVAALKGA